MTWNDNDAWVFELGSAASTLAIADSTPGLSDLLNITGAGSDFLKGTGSSFTFDAPKTGKYHFVAGLATPKPNQKLFATANGGPAVKIALPYIIGLWGKTSPIEIELKAGSNVLKFHGPARTTFDRFSLTPTS